MKLLFSATRAAPAVKSTPTKETLVGVYTPWRRDG